MFLARRYPFFEKGLLRTDKIQIYNIKEKVNNFYVIWKKIEALGCNYHIISLRGLVLLQQTKAFVVFFVVVMPDCAIADCTIPHSDSYHIATWLHG